MADRREVIEKAWEETESVSEEQEAPGAESVAKETTAQEDEPKESVAAKEPTSEKTEDPLDVEKRAAADRAKPEHKSPAQPQQSKPATTEAVTDKAPVSWKPAQRELWASLPAEVRAEINRRERQIQETLTQTDNVRKFANDFAQIVQPYSHLIAQAGSTPLRAVDSMMRTAAVLTTGSQEQKAQTLVNLIAQYGVDIPTLDKVLSGVVKDGKVQGATPQQEQPPAWARPMFEFMSTVQQQRMAAQQAAAAEAQQAVESFSEKPFFEDLREEMADLIEVAARRGRAMTMEEAYERAVQANPEIRAIVQQRQAAAKARNPVSEAAATLARARKAASTVASAPAGESAGTVSAAKTRREAIAAAWEAAEAR